MDSKTLCIMGLLDQDADHAFSDLYFKMSQRNIPIISQPPHLTFGIYDNVNQKDLLNWVAHIAHDQEELELNFNHIGLFQQGICFAEPCVSLELLHLHQRLHAKYDQNCDDKNCLYSVKEKGWVPHTTLAVLDSDQIGSVMPIILELFTPIQATIKSLVVTEYPPLKKIGEFPLIK